MLAVGSGLSTLGKARWARDVAARLPTLRAERGAACPRDPLANRNHLLLGRDALPLLGPRLDEDTVPSKSLAVLSQEGLEIVTGETRRRPDGTARRPDILLDRVASLLIVTSVIARLDLELSGKSSPAPCGPRVGRARLSRVPRNEGRQLSGMNRGWVFDDQSGMRPRSFAAWTVVATSRDPRSVADAVDDEPAERSAAACLRGHRYTVSSNRLAMQFVDCRLTSLPGAVRAQHVKPLWA